MMKLLDRRFIVTTILLTLAFRPSNAGLVDGHLRLPHPFSNSGSTESNESDTHSDEKSQGGIVSTGSNNRLTYMLRLYADFVRYIPIIGEPLYRLFTDMSEIMDGNTGIVLEAAMPCSISMSDGLQCVPIRNFSDFRNFVTKYFLPRVPDSVLTDGEKRMIELLFTIFSTPNIGA